MNFSRAKLVKNKESKRSKRIGKIKEYLNVMREKANKVFWIPGNHDPLDCHLHD